MNKVPEIILLKHLAKKLLGKILRVFRPVSLPADKRIHRRPVYPAKLLQRRVRLRKRAVFGSPHHAPMRGGKYGANGARALVFCVWRTHERSIATFMNAGE